MTWIYPIIYSTVTERFREYCEARYDRTYSLDVLPQEFPTYGMSDFRIPTIVVQYEDGSYALDLVYHSHKIYPVNIY